MPELPEAETITRELNAVMPGCRIGQVVVHRTDVIHGDSRPLAELLPGRRVCQVVRRAKRVVITLDPPAELVFHLGMSGRLNLAAHGEPLAKHTHLCIRIGRIEKELRFCDPRRFGGVWMLTHGKGHTGRQLGPLGPEPLTLTQARFWRVLRRSRQIKALLLDQRALAGMGNIYCDEALHAAGIHPLTKADALDAETARRLLRSIKRTLRKAIRYKGTTMMDYRQANGATGSFQRFHRVYHREGKPCRNCGTPIARIMAAGRSSFICPNCQILVG